LIYNPYGDLEEEEEDYYYSDEDEKEDKEERIRRAFPVQYPPSLTKFEVRCSRARQSIVSSVLQPSLPPHVKFIIE
jgi:hypothetical protein